MGMMMKQGRIQFEVVRVEMLQVDIYDPVLKTYQPCRVSISMVSVLVECYYDRSLFFKYVRTTKIK